MNKVRLIIPFILVLITSASIDAIGQEAQAIQPYARNVARVIQDFEQAHAKKHQRPEKFCTIPTGKSNQSLLWVSTFDESYGCLFSSANGRLERLLNVGYNARGEHVDLAFRNGVMIVTSSDAAGNIVGAQFYRFANGVLEPLDFSMRQVDGREVYVDSKGKEVKAAKVQKELDKGLKKNETAQVMNSETLQWIPFRKIGNYIDANDDITLSQLPVLTRASYNKNEFTTSGATMLPASSYSHIVFKKQVGDASVKSAEQGKAVYELNDPNGIKTMFRGYKDNELYPILVTSEYLESHRMMPFSRWKYPERVTPMEREKQQAVSEHYGGMTIKNSRWLANLEESDRKLYAVEFKAQSGLSLAVIACFIGNRLVSTFEQWAVVDKGRNWLWTPGDKGDFMNALPELQGLALTDEGFELYMSQMVGENRHMIVLREVGTMFIELIDQEF
ncbi:MAG: hypothetical protein IJP59_01590 [Muribaculaceae bacterium]|nr:hypothetical protein [Muribaculaceae bacterium]